jgi:hypothetical protein
VAILNTEAEARGIEQRFSSTSRIVKHIYDKIHDSYDGKYDADKDVWTEYRTTFFSPEEIWQMAADSLGLDGGDSTA